jgi:hypothetical protein
MTKPQGITGQSGALDFLRAVAEQPDAGTLDVQHEPGVDRAHDGELKQVLGSAFRSGAPVEQHEIAAGRWHHAGQSRTIDPLEPTHPHARRGDQSARIAGGDDCVRLAVLDLLHRTEQRAVLLPPEALNGLVLHGQDFAGVDDLQARFLPLHARQAFLDLCPAAHRDQAFDRRVGLQAGSHAVKDLLRAMVPTHDVDGESHKRTRAAPS